MEAILFQDPTDLLGCVAKFERLPQKGIDANFL
jgi:hypothetical protein